MILFLFFVLPFRKNKNKRLLMVVKEMDKARTDFD